MESRLDFYLLVPPFFILTVQIDLWREMSQNLIESFKAPE